MATETIVLAYDRSPANRYYDKFGRLHVRVSNISKATVNPYRGSEIPNHKGLGLDPDRVYMLLRDPEELAKAASTFNNIPLLNKHVPVTVENPEQKLVVGSTGTDCVFKEGYLKQSLVVWVEGSILGIESEEEDELSSAYAYDADMTAGTFEGLHYDGIMRNIVGNHVALVSEGRAGPDVVVGDEQPEIFSMAKAALKSRKAILLHGALSTALLPLLAQDAKIDVSPLLVDITRANFKASKPAIMAGLKKLTVGKLAQDADIGGIVTLLDALEKVEDGDADEDLIEDQPAVDADDPMSKVMAFLAGKLSDEDMAECTKLASVGATDEDTLVNDPDAPEGPTDKDPPAMDAKMVAKAVKDAETRAVNRVNAINEAKEIVEPIVGKLKVAMDSAAGVYKLALDHAKVDVKDVHPSAYRAMVLMLPKAAKPAADEIAMDGADAEAEFRAQFPTAAKLRRS